MGRTRRCSRCITWGGGTRFCRFWRSIWPSTNRRKTFCASPFGAVHSLGRWFWGIGENPNALAPSRRWLLETARTREALAQVSAGEEAASLLGRALETFEAIGARPSAERVRAIWS